MQFLNQLKFFSRQNCLLLRNAVSENASRVCRYKSASKSENITVIDLPLKPKKPSTAFLRFMQVFRKDFVQKNPGCKITDVVKAASAEWKNYSVEQKAPFVDEYVKLSLKYAEDLIKYESLLTPEQKEEILRLKKSEMKRQVEKKMKNLNKPKMPLSTFALFLSDSKAEVKEYKDVKDWFKAKCADWKNLPEEKKRKYIEQQSELKKKYLEELLKWEESILNSTNAYTAHLKERIIGARKSREYLSAKKNIENTDS